MPEPAVLPAFKSEPWIASLLFRAVADGRWEDAVSALRGGADPHFPNASGFNLFHHCALARDGQSAARVLDALPPAQIRGLAALWPSKTPLMLAARSDSPEVALRRDEGIFSDLKFSFGAGATCLVVVEEDKLERIIAKYVQSKDTTLSSSLADTGSMGDLLGDMDDETESASAKDEGPGADVDDAPERGGESFVRVGAQQPAPLLPSRKSDLQFTRLRGARHDRRDPL